MAAPLIAQGLIQKAPEILETTAVIETTRDIRQSVLTEEGREGWGHTIKSAAKGVKEGLENAAETTTSFGQKFGPTRFVASTLLGNYKSPKTLEDNAILTAIIEYRKSYGSSHKEDQAEKKFWDVIEKNMNDRKQPVKIDINKATDALMSAKRMSTNVAAVAAGGREGNVCGGKLEGIIAAAVIGGTEQIATGGGGGNGGGGINININMTIMILSAIFLIAIAYIALNSITGGSSVGGVDQKFTKNTIIVSGVLILLLGCLSFVK